MPVQKKVRPQKKDVTYRDMGAYRVECGNKKGQY